MMTIQFWRLNQMLFNNSVVHISPVFSMYSLFIVTRSLVLHFSHKIRATGWLSSEFIQLLWQSASVCHVYEIPLSSPGAGHQPSSLNAVPSSHCGPTSPNSNHWSSGGASLLPVQRGLSAQQPSDVPHSKPALHQLWSSRSVPFRPLSQPVYGYQNPSVHQAGWRSKGLWFVWGLLHVKAAGLCADVAATGKVSTFQIHTSESWKQHWVHRPSCGPDQVLSRKLWWWESSREGQGQAGEPQLCLPRGWWVLLRTFPFITSK